jgi:hypothetical protein
MITVIRTATAFPGMTGEAIAWAKEVAALAKRVTGKEQFVCTSFGGMLADPLDRRCVYVAEKLCSHKTFSVYWFT